MRYRTVCLVATVFTFLAGVTAASMWEALTERAVQPQSVSVVQPVPSVEISPCVSGDSPIREVDFEFGRPMHYGDVTGDGQEEVVIMEGLESHGSAIPYRVHIYTLRSGKPKLLWRFDTGDRAEGGLRRAYVEDGDLVVEIYGKNSTLEDPYHADGHGACCAQYFNRMRYEWNGRRFTSKGQREVFINHSGAASPELDDLPHRRCAEDR